MKSLYAFPLRPTMTAQEVAEALGVTPNHIYRQAQKGQLPTVSGLGRRVVFPTEAIKRMLHIDTEKPASVGAEAGLT